MTARHRAGTTATQQPGRHRRVESRRPVPRALVIVAPLALLCAAVLASTASSGAAERAPAQPATVFIEAVPSTVPAGGDVVLRASCEDNLIPATASSDVFGTVTLKPDHGFLVARAHVPATTGPGTYDL